MPCLTAAGKEKQQLRPGLTLTLRCYSGSSDRGIQRTIFLSERRKIIFKSIKYFYTIIWCHIIDLFSKQPGSKRDNVK